MKIDIEELVKEREQEMWDKALNKNSKIHWFDRFCILTYPFIAPFCILLIIGCIIGLILLR